MRTPFYIFIFAGRVEKNLSPPPGGGWPGKAGSGEEFGQKPESLHKRTDLLPSRSTGGGL